ncbi:extracellular solute-binding protein family 3 [Ruminiclostridium papyrosolvens DSM 2782]|uniref:Extracellular solute-binding protein family 3 n=1 Tax=Ruminiclostridium papyrosolvens DSM 2782 TaxID=588581 RepID=F1THY3_9FIRM|nr:amino acid ABC transporter substrate-binding protein [Ruminiclostridium papyrosolvens]EGD45918.1 extracellular solute-binding protein family 3 [Ruminiclostridium papyrosolvens DSM 2782]WES33692.1 amino acid ABC transporter substrate-binding protein [Ruminiclostridium papyrosolvens DSM 2782]
MKKGKLIKVLASAMALTFLIAGCGTPGDSSSSSSTASESKVAENTAVSNTSTGEKSWDKVKDKGELVLGLDENFPPMGFRDGNNNIVGYDIDLAKEVAARLGVKLKIQPINWDSKDQELNTGNIDCIWNGFSINEERKANILFSDPYMKNNQVVVVAADSKFKTLADLKGKSVSLQAQSSAADAIDKNTDFKKSLKDVVELKDNTLCLMDLKTGNTDGVVMDEIVARYQIKMNSEKYRILDESLAAEEYGVGFRKADVQLMTKVNDTLKTMAKEGKIAEISNVWFGKDISIIGK